MAALTNGAVRAAIAVQKEITVAALGRPSFLGQLYNGYTGSLLNDQLFPEAAIKAATNKDPRTKSATNTDFDYKEVRSSAQRASSLDVSASIQCNIMGGAMELKGSGSYLDRSDSTEDAVTIAGIVNITTEFHNIDITDFHLKQSVSMTPEKMKKTGATHVVTGIVYGGTLLTNLTETNFGKTNDTALGGHFSLKLFKALGGLAGAKGGADIDSKDKTTLSQYDLQIRLLADYLDPDPDVKAPLTVQEMSKKIFLALKLLQGNVPYTLTLTPLSWFSGISAELIFRELEEDSLLRVIDLYDDLVTLYEQRLALAEQLRFEQSEFFPSFQNTCEDRTNAVELLLIRSRGELGDFLHSARSQQGINTIATATEFIGRVQQLLNDEKDLFDQDLALWDETFTPMLDTSNNARFPLASIPTLSATMTAKERTPIVLVLLTANSPKTAILNIYRGLADLIDKWYKDQGSARTSAPKYFSFFADDLLDADLLSLDDENGALKLALEESRTKSMPFFLSYGIARDPFDILAWSAPGHETWGVVDDQFTKSKYVGDLKNGRPHGLGVLENLVDDTSFVGSWFEGKRDGQGHLLKGDAVVDPGIYVDNILQPNGLMVEVSVFDKGVPIDSAIVAVDCYASRLKLGELTGEPAVAPTQAEIEKHLPAQIAKFAKALNWQDGQRHRLAITWEAARFIAKDVDPASEHTDGAKWEPIPNVYQFNRSSFDVLTNGAAVENMQIFEDNITKENPLDPLGAWRSPWIRGTAGGWAFWETSVDFIVANVEEYGVPVLLEARRLP